MKPRPRRTLSAFLCALTALGVADPVRGGDAPERFPGPEIRVGIDSGDMHGADFRVLQAAVDYVGGLGGGTVHIGPGRYLMRNALTLRDGVRLVGVPGQTILVACDGFTTPLAEDGDCNQREVTVVDPSGLRVGDGISVVDKDASGGFYVTTATLTARSKPNTFRLSRPLYADYQVARHAVARLAFPIVGAWQVKHAAIEGLTVEGNRAKSQPLDGCRGGGIYFFECEDIAIRNCVVRAYQGDGISFQVSHDIVVENCVAENNAGHGLHPGSGSQRPVLKHNRATGNGRDGLYVCWRVRHGLFQDNELVGNEACGVSIGHKDSDNLFQGNQVVGNTRSGITFRNESAAMGAHRNRFEKNVILDNGPAKLGVAVAIHGEHHDLTFRDNIIGYSKPRTDPGVGIQATEASQGLVAGDNSFRNVSTKINVSPKPEK